MAQSAVSYLHRSACTCLECIQLSQRPERVVLHGRGSQVRAYLLAAQRKARPDIAASADGDAARGPRVMAAPPRGPPCSLRSPRVLHKLTKARHWRGLGLSELHLLTSMPPSI